MLTSCGFTYGDEFEKLEVANFGSCSGRILPVDIYEPPELMIVGGSIGQASITDNDISLMALVTMAEAEGECEEGKRLVVDTILNRVDSAYFPDNVYDVVYQPGQFASMWNGRINRCKVMDYIRQLVIEELEARTNREVIFFRTRHYSTYGTPLFKIEHHYFSSYE
jgi:hypothetical protein